MRQYFHGRFVLPTAIGVISIFFNLLSLHLTGIQL
jgi:hypothetical protein